MIELLPTISPYYHASFWDASLPTILLLCFLGLCGLLRDAFSEDSIWNELFNDDENTAMHDVYSEIEQI